VVDFIYGIMECRMILMMKLGMRCTVFKELLENGLQEMKCADS
jgi:hypothetical protein